jgi:hypothetical protein
VFGDLLSTFWQKIVSLGTLVGLGCKKSQNWHFLLKLKYIDNESIFFYEVKCPVSIYRWNQHYISFKMHTKNRISGNHSEYVMT